MTTATLVAIVLAAATCAPAQGLVERHVFAMGTTLSVEVRAPLRSTALAASEAAVRAAAEVERRLSVWRADSDVSRINSAPIGVLVGVDRITVADLRWALRLAAKTGSAFDPSVGSLVSAYGLRDGGRWPDAAALAAAKAAVGGNWFSFEDAGVVRHRTEASLDCDAFGKGLALDHAAVAARAAGATGVLLDFGGQVAVVGDLGRELWLPIVHPVARERIVAEVLLAPGWSAATSGNGERAESADGRRVLRLLDPRSGLPAADFGSATAIANGAALADAASTACFVLGPRDPALLQVCGNLGAEAVLVEFTGIGTDHCAAVRVRATAGLAGRVRAIAGVVEFFATNPGSSKP